MFKTCLLLTGLLFGFSYEAYSASFSDTTLVAQNTRSKKLRSGKKKILTGEARTSSSKTNIDFEAAAIEGERRAPMGVAIGSNKPDHQYDLIKLRLRWHPEMVQSTSKLETGRGR